MPKEQKQLLAGVIALVLVVIFAAAYAPILWDAWNNPGTTPNPVTAPTALMTILSAGVGGFLATLFGVPAPAFGVKVFGGPGTAWRTALAWVYVLIYFGVTAAAAVLWLTKSPVTPEVIQTQAQVGIGLGLAIAASLAKEV